VHLTNALDFSDVVRICGALPIEGNTSRFSDDTIDNDAPTGSVLEDCKITLSRGPSPRSQPIFVLIFVLPSCIILSLLLFGSQGDERHYIRRKTIRWQKASPCQFTQKIVLF
jgi:hypothetical protein